MHSFLQIILVQFILFFNLSRCKIASVARNCINYVPQTAATTFAFSSVLILLLWQGDIYSETTSRFGLVWSGTWLLPTQQRLQGWTAVPVQPCQVQEILQQDEEVLPKTDNEFRFLIVNEAISNRHSSMEQNCRPFPSI